jgi:hypothetical protein
MNQAKIQACWDELAPLVREATQILKEWHKYNRQADRLNELQQRARAACARGSYLQGVGEPHWAVLWRINDSRSVQTSICKRAIAVLLNLEGVLQPDQIELLKPDIDSTSVRRTCQIILTMAQVLGENCGPAPAGWPGVSGGDADVILDNAVINALEKQVQELETGTEDLLKQRESVRESTEQQCTIKNQSADKVEAQTQATPEVSPHAQRKGAGGRSFKAYNWLAIDRIRQIPKPDHETVEKVLKDIRSSMESKEGILSPVEWARRRHNLRSSLKRTGLLPSKKE